MSTRALSAMSHGVRVRSNIMTPSRLLWLQPWSLVLLLEELEIFLTHSCMWRQNKQDRLLGWETGKEHAAETRTITGVCVWVCVSVSEWVCEWVNDAEAESLPVMPPPLPCPFLRCRMKKGLALSLTHSALASSTSSGLSHILITDKGLL